MNKGGSITMKSDEFFPTEENLFQTFIVDSIDRDEDVLLFSHMLDIIEGSYSIAVDGKWGSGKTFFVKQVKMVLDAHNEFSQDIDAEKKTQIIQKCASLSRNHPLKLQPQICVYYDAWTNDADEDPVLSLVYEIIRSVGTDYSFANGKGFAKKAAAVIELFTGQKWLGVVDAFKKENPLQEIKNAKCTEEKVAEFLDSLMEERGNRLVVFIDELDRCRPNFAVKLLERIKHYFSNDRITFVFSVNASELQHTIRQYYGNGFDASRYLERFFDRWIALPPANMEKYYRNIGFNNGHYYYDSTCEAIIKKYGFSFREIVKYLRMAKTARDKIALGSDSFSEYADIFCAAYIVPILLGLHIKNVGKYCDFIEGRDYLPLLDAIDALNGNLLGLISTDNEIGTGSGRETIVFNVDERLKNVYDAIFNENYNRGVKYETIIGNCRFNAHTKTALLQRVSLLFNNANLD